MHGTPQEQDLRDTGKEDQSKACLFSKHALPACCKMSYDEVEIEDMQWNDDLQAYTYQCPCGDLFQISLARSPLQAYAHALCLSPGAAGLAAAGCSACCAKLQPAEGITCYHCYLSV